MRQFRKDPLSNRWVAYAQGREDRPNEFESGVRRLPGTQCPFCAGNEKATPPQIAVYTAGSRSPLLGADSNGAEWLVRVVPNKYPAFRPQGDTKVSRDGLYEGTGAVGDHEVIVESPRHLASLSELSDQEVKLLLLAYRDRIVALRNTRRFKYALVFKNVGPHAGASLEHTHSQVMATPMVPTEVAGEISAAWQLYNQHQACFFCRVVADELARGDRLVTQTDRFVAVCPYASRMPYEMWVLPRDHASFFEAEPDDALEEVALLLRRLVTKLESLHENLSYNYFIHTTPFDTSMPRHYHWHIEIFPRLTITAGFEWGAGYYINPVTPEQAAAVLRF
jgi:UDPglucose--hexose-1-phosphate uridylyltransferase